MAHWHIHVDGETRGPFDDRQLQSLIENGTINARTPVWTDGMANWEPLENSGFTAASFASAAPGTMGTADPNAIDGNQNAVEPDERSMWGFFTRALTSRYAQFSGRARRKEYWSYTLFYYLTAIVLAVITLSIDYALGSISPNAAGTVPRVTAVVLGLAFLATLIPTILYWRAPPA
ncbi:MAG: GYF domain-containing protein [Pseudomonadota bacterium]